MSEILIVEDNKRLASSLEKGLNEAGYTTCCATNVIDARACYEEARPNLVLLDLGLPDGDGITLLEYVRQTDQTTVFIIITARDLVTERIHGLESGAEDYVTKPFSFPELLARVRAQLRRSVSSSNGLIEVGALKIDRLSQKVACDGTNMDLTPKEFELLQFLAANKETVVSRDRIIHELWPDAANNITIHNVLDVHLSHLRVKLRELGCSSVKTVRGVGIKLEEQS